ncbi:MAG: hypothetical protein FWD57_16540 [Polyangiaceae bacterium]|nr:hypothetical protein [Polyangiaceae bacterium]
MTVEPVAVEPAFNDGKVNLQLRSLPMNKFKLIPLGAILVIVGVLVLVSQYRSGELPLFQNTNTVAGIVTNRYTKQASNSLIPVPYLSIRVGVGGKEHVIEQKVDDEFWESHPMESPVTLEIRGSDLRTAKVSGASSTEWVVWAKSGACLLAVVVGLLVLVYERLQKYGFVR